MISRDRPIRPPALRPGATVAVVSPSWGGPGTFPHRYSAGVDAMVEALDIDVVEMPHTSADPEYLARHPERRAADLVEAWTASDADAVIASIGGEDSIRVLRHVDPAMFTEHPKPFCGYSDSTTLTMAGVSAGVVTFNGPSVMAGWAENGGPDPYMVDGFRRLVCSADPAGVLPENPDGWTEEFLDWADPANQQVRRTRQPASGWRYHGSGTATGRLLGGCMEVLEVMKGTRWWPSAESWDGAILCLETSEERPSPSQVAWWMRNYAATGVLGRLAGILMGRPQGAVDPSVGAAYDEAVLGVVRGEEKLNIPVVTGMDFGHTDPQLTLPLGVAATIDCGARTVSIVEPAVTDSTTDSVDEIALAPGSD